MIILAQIFIDLEVILLMLISVLRNNNLYSQIFIGLFYGIRAIFLVFDLIIRILRNYLIHLKSYGVLLLSLVSLYPMELQGISTIAGIQDLCFSAFFGGRDYNTNL
jgi:hypothetical protein